MWPRGEGASRSKARLVKKMEKKRGFSGGAAREKAAGSLGSCLRPVPALPDRIFCDDGNMLLVLSHNAASSHLGLLST